MKWKCVAKKYRWTKEVEVDREKIQVQRRSVKVSRGGQGRRRGGEVDKEMEVGREDLEAGWKKWGGMGNV
jgi:hypothetical protein